jgi:hypothetical protein
VAYLDYFKLSFFTQRTPEENSPLLRYIPDIQNAAGILYKDSIVIRKILPDKNAREILSIGFPEVIRWNEFRDVIEINTNRFLYVRHGSEYADFSVGIFQMKPSFIENIENYYAIYLPSTQRSLFFDIILSDKLESNNRAARVDRLEKLEWQLKYLKLYWYVANHKFANVKFKNKEDRIRFYSAAYNFGFTRSSDEIKKWQSKHVFPFGKNYKGEQVSYSDISIFFLMCIH